MTLGAARTGRRAFTFIPMEPGLRLADPAPATPASRIIKRGKSCYSFPADSGSVFGGASRFAKHRRDWSRLNTDALVAARGVRGVREGAARALVDSDHRRHIPSSDSRSESCRGRPPCRRAGATIRNPGATRAGGRNACGNERIVGSGEPHFRELEPTRRVAASDRGSAVRRVIRSLAGAGSSSQDLSA